MGANCHGVEEDPGGHFVDLFDAPLPAGLEAASAGATPTS